MDNPLQRMKQQVSAEDYDRLLVVGEETDGVGVHKINERVYDRMRREVWPSRDEPLPYRARYFRHKTEPLSCWLMMALELALVLECEQPTDCLESRNATLQVHKDVTMPYPATSAVVLFGEGMNGGELVFPELRLGVSITENCVITFDGANVEHGVTKLKPRTDDSWRVSLTYYIPK